MTDAMTEPTNGAPPRLEARLTPLAGMKPHPRNYREHPQDQLDHVKASITEHGLYRNVVLARDGTILAGHGVVLAAQQLGLTEIPAITLGDVDPESPRALKILVGDNEISKLGLVDDRMLTDMLKKLDEDLGSLLGTGFDEKMLAGLAFVTRTSGEIGDKGEAAHWAGMPEFDLGADVLILMVQFLSEEDRRAFFAKLSVNPDAVVGMRKGSGGKKMSMWWPPREENDVASVALTETTGGAG